MSHFIWFLVTFDVVSASKRKSCSIVTWNILHVTSIVEKAVHTPLVDHKDFVVHNEPVLQIFSVVTYRAVRIYTQYFTWKMFFFIGAGFAILLEGLEVKIFMKILFEKSQKSETDNSCNSKLPEMWWIIYFPQACFNVPSRAWPYCTLCPNW